MRTQDPRPRTSEPGLQDHGTRDPGLRTQNLGPETEDPVPNILNLGVDKNF